MGMDTGNITLLNEHQIQDWAVHLLSTGELRRALTGEGARPMSELRRLKARAALAGELLLGLSGLRHDGVLYTCQRRSYVHLTVDPFLQPASQPDLGEFLRIAEHMHVWLRERTALLMEGRHSIDDANFLAAKAASKVIGGGVVIGPTSTLVFEKLALRLARAKARSIELSTVGGPSVNLTVPARVHQRGTAADVEPSQAIPAQELTWTGSHSAIRLADGRTLVLPQGTDPTQFPPGAIVEFHRVPTLRSVPTAVAITHFEPVDFPEEAE